MYQAVTLNSKISYWSSLLLRWITIQAFVISSWRQTNSSHFFDSSYSSDARLLRLCNYGGPLCAESLCLCVTADTSAHLHADSSGWGCTYTHQLSPPQWLNCATRQKGAAGIQTAIKVKMAVSNPTTIFPFVKIIITILVAWWCSAQAEETQRVEGRGGKHRGRKRKGPS